MKIDLSRKEVETLLLILHEQNVCRNGCVYPHMQTSEIDCDKCRFPKLVSSIIDRLEIS